MSGLFGPLERYAAAQRELLSASARSATVSWTVDLDQAGQTDVDVSFATFFLELPIFTWGCVALAPIEDGAVPLCSAVVRSWSQTDRGFWVGANVGFAVWQIPGVEAAAPVLSFHLQFDGIATPTIHGLEG